MAYLILTSLASFIIFTESRYADLSQAWATEKEIDLGKPTYQRSEQLKKLLILRYADLYQVLVNKKEFTRYADFLKAFTGK